MCWVCNPIMKNALATNHWADLMGIDTAHFEALSSGETAAVAASGAAEDGPVASGATDTVPDGITNNNPELVVEGDTIVSAIDAPGDQDFFKIELTAGQTYEVGQYAAAGGPTGVPLSDAYLELYDAAGNLLASADGGGPNTPSGLDALLTFRPETSGTYYINARAFDNVPEDGNDGDVVGDYELFARESDYVPYYDIDSPLHSIDWGTQVNRVHQTVRNPDGDEGPRDTGNPPAPEGTVTGDALGYPGKNVISIYFAREGDVFVSEDPANPGLPPVLVSAGTQDWEKDVVNTALDEFEKVADVVYIEVDTREEADFFFTTYAGTPGPGVSLLGSMSPPDYYDEGLAQFNSGDYRWTEENLQQGGFSYVTLIHEFGHGHGLAHPHDNGGRSSVMRGVEPDGPVASYTLGDYQLNQGVYTMMSYEDGWQQSPYGNAATDAGYGYLGGLMAFDIAVIQDKYGVNEDTALGNDVYRMKDVNAQGTYYESIWDAGGTDIITYGGARNSRIDLRDATLEYEYGGGGIVSYAHGIFGGFTIANSVTIEHARSGSGNDRLTGNEVANQLTSLDGNDTLRGLGGSDQLRGGDGYDRMLGGSQGDRVYGGDGADLMHGQTGNDSLAGDAGADAMRGGDGNDRIAGGVGEDRINGNLGNDLIIGGAGRDQLRGGSGEDVFSFDEGDTGATRATADRIFDFSGHNEDTINLAQIDAIAGTAADDAFSFIGTQGFSGNAGELRYQVIDGDAFVSGDTNGDSTADFFIQIVNKIEVLETQFVL